MEMNEETEQLLDDPERNFNSFSQKRSQSIFKISCRRIVTILVLVFSQALNVAFILKASNYQVSPREIFGKTNFYSPAIDRVNLKLETRQFNGAFLPSSPYSGVPRPELDSAWDEISAVRISRITEEELENSRFSNDHVSIPDAEGGFMAHFEFMHQLHCLNMLRMSTFYNYDHYHAEDPMMVNNSPLFINHIRHCIEMLRQVLTCNADMGVLPLIWIKSKDNETKAVPDFNTWHVCKDFHSRVDFLKERMLPEMEMWGPKDGEIMLDRAVYFGFEEDEEDEM